MKNIAALPIHLDANTTFPSGKAYTNFSLDKVDFDELDALLSINDITQEEYDMLQRIYGEIGNRELSCTTFRVVNELLEQKFETGREKEVRNGQANIAFADAPKVTVRTSCHGGDLDSLLKASMLVLNRGHTTHLKNLYLNKRRRGCTICL
jgi:hypothetical protein